MCHSQEYHPEFETRSAMQPGSSNHLREVLGSLLCSRSDLMLSILISGSWLKENTRLCKVVVQYDPRSNDIPTRDQPGIMALEAPWLGVDP